MIFPFYKKFLCVLTSWNNLSPEYMLKRFRNEYIEENPAFFKFYYFEYLGLTQKSLDQRILAIREEHYGQTKEVIKSVNLEEQAGKIISKFLEISTENINLFLIIGFFSPEGFSFTTSKFPEKNIVIGLERFKEPELLPIILAHECGHCLFELKESLSLFEKLLREGLAFNISEQINSKSKLHKILLISSQDLYYINKNLAWIKLGIVNKKYLVQDLFKFSSDNLPSRFGNVVAYRFVKSLLKKMELNKIVEIKNPEKLFREWIKE